MNGFRRGLQWAIIPETRLNEIRLRWESSFVQPLLTETATLFHAGQSKMNRGFIAVRYKPLLKLKMN
jgi:hypothetical protein